MVTQRLDIRLDPERREKLRELASEQGAAVSEVVRRLIDLAYEERMRERRRQAAREIGEMQIEAMPDPEELSRQLEATYEPGGIY